MMQPILSSPAASTQTSGTVDKSPKSDELLAQEGEQIGKFSDLFNSAIEEPKNIKGAAVNGELAEAEAFSGKLAETGTLAKTELSSEGLIETELPSDGLIEVELPSDEGEEIDDFSDELLSDDSNDETDIIAASGELPSTIAQPTQNLEENTKDASLSLENADLAQDAPDPSVFSGAITGENRSAVKTETQQEADVSPILAQIQAAQKMDTQVTDVQKTTQLAETATPVKELNVVHSGQLSASVGDDKSLKAGMGEKNVINGESKNIFVESLKSAQGNTVETVKNESSKFELPQQSVDKQGEALFANHSATDKTVLTHSFDSGSLRTTDVSAPGVSKLVNQNIHNAAPTALQESLDIQSKHASTLLGERVLMMINQGKQEVQIRLDPAELGSMHLKLQMHQNQVHLAIQTDVSQSKDIIEQNLPRLREQLAQQGVNLGETSVGQHAQGQQNASQQGGSATAQRNASTAITDDSLFANMDDNMTLTSLKIPISERGIDYYA